MILRRLHLQNFRNIALARLDPGGPRQFFLGPNGMGKSNLLEAAGLLGALRSFRGAEPRELLRHGAAEARVLAELEHERDGAATVELVLRAPRREVLVNGAPCRRLADFLGRFPVVALAGQDLQLLRGAPAARRRALDLAVSSVDEKYFNALRRYQQALDGRNALLRGPRAPAEAELAAFEAPMADEAATLGELRLAACGQWDRLLRPVYQSFTGGAPEQPGLAFAPDGEAATAAVWRGLWAAGRARDLAAKSTLRGPHRDDFTFQLDVHDAKAFASEGQQRGLVLAWRLAQAAWLRERTGVAPLLLADDVLGELDPARRTGFWRALPACGAQQVLATGTTPPDDPAEGWTTWIVRDGEFFRA